MASAVDNLRGLALSADEIRRMTGWTEDKMIEDYLTIVRNFTEVAGIVDENEANALLIQSEVISGVANNYASMGKARSMISSVRKRSDTNRALIHAW